MLEAEIIRVNTSYFTRLFLSSVYYLVILIKTAQAIASYPHSITSLHLADHDLKQIVPAVLYAVVAQVFFLQCFDW